MSLMDSDAESAPISMLTLQQLRILLYKQL